MLYWIHPKKLILQLSMRFQMIGCPSNRAKDYSLVINIGNEVVQPDLESTIRKGRF